MIYDLSEIDLGFAENFAAHVVLVQPRMKKSPLAEVIAFMEGQGEFDWGYRVSDYYCDAHGRTIEQGDYIRCIFGMNDPNMAFEIRMRFG